LDVEWRESRNCQLIREARKSKPSSPLKKWLDAVQKVPDARQAKLFLAKAGIRSNTEAYFLYVE
jgi:hypothetical protein